MNIHTFSFVHLCIYFSPLNLKPLGIYYYFYIDCQNRQSITVLTIGKDVGKV